MNAIISGNNNNNNALPSEHNIFTVVLNITYDK